MSSNTSPIYRPICQRRIKRLLEKIQGINDLATFEGSSVDELKSAFEDAVRDCIEICA